MYGDVLQCVAVCVAVRCSVLQCVIVCCGVLQCVAVCCSLRIVVWGASGDVLRSCGVRIFGPHPDAQALFPRLFYRIE